MCSQPPRNVSAVLAGSFQYPSIACGERCTISPTSPAGTGLPSSSTTSVSTLSAGRPAEPALRTWSSGRSTVATGDISVWP